MSVEALLGTDRVFAADLQALRPHPGQAASARRTCAALLRGSAIMASHRGPDCTRVQDAYSLRCSPQVHGAARDTLALRRDASPTASWPSPIDNPVVLADGRVESNGNFHGAPVAYVLDFLAIAVADVASIAERRTDRMLDVHALARPAAVPRRRPRRRLRPHDRPVHPGRRSSPSSSAWPCPASVDSIPSSARCRRTTSRWAGPPPASCARPSTASPGPRHRVPHRRARPRPARAAQARPRDRGRRGEAARDGPGPRPGPPPRARDRRRRSPDPEVEPCDGCSRARGTTLTAKGWPQEAALRMLQNNLDPEVAEHPEELVVYGGTGKAARDWPSFDAMVRTLTHARGRTRRCWCSPAARSASCAPTSGRRAC